VAVNLREALTYLALTTGAKIDIIHSAAPVPGEEPESDAERDLVESRLPPASALDELGGVGAVLRFSMDQE
jgi:hypothetical protein